MGNTGQIVRFRNDKCWMRNGIILKRMSQNNHIIAKFHNYVYLNNITGDICAPDIRKLYESSRNLHNLSLADHINYKVASKIQIMGVTVFSGNRGLKTEGMAD